MRCPSCGERGRRGARYCGRCGATVRPADDVRLVDGSGRTRADRDGARPRRVRLLALAASLTAVAAAVAVTLGTMRSSAPAEGTTVPVRGEPGGTGYFPGSPAVTQPTELWRSGPVRPAARAVPRDRIDVTADDDTVVVSDETGLVGLERIHGEVRWRRPLGPTAGAPTLTDGTALVSTVRDVVAVDTDTGAERWRAETGPEHGARVVAAGSGVAVIAEHRPQGDVLVGLSLADGARRWERALPDGHRGRPAPAGTAPHQTAGGDVALVHVDVAHEPGSSVADRGATRQPAALLAVDLATGEERWSSSRPAVGYVVDDVTALLLTDPEGERGLPPELVARDLRDGRVRWREPVRRTAQVLAVTERTVHLAEGATITELDPRDGRTRRHTLDRVVTPVLGASRVGDLLIIATTTRNSMAIAAPDLLLAVDVGDGTVVWSREGPASRPVAVGGTAVVTTDDGVEAVDVDDGDRRWTFRAEHPGGCSTSRAGSALVVAFAGRVLTLDPTDGRLLTELSGGGSREAPPFRVAVPPSVDVTAPNGGGPLVAVAAPGERALGTTVTAWPPDGDDAVWHRRVHPARLIPPLLATDDTLLVATGERQPTLTALTSAAGAVRWSRHLGPSAATGPTGHADVDPSADRLLAARDGLVVVTDGGRPAARATADGRALWVAEDDGGGVATDAVLGDDTALVTDGAAVRGLSAATGATRWARQLSAAGTTSLALAPGMAVVATHDRIAALDERSGTTMWEAALASPVASGMSIAGGHVHVATVAGLEVLDLDSGRQVGATTTDRAPISAPLLADGRIYLCHADGTVAAYH